MMTRLFFLFALLLFSGTTYAQLDKSKGVGTGGGIGIPAVETTTSLPKKDGTFNYDGLLKKEEKELDFFKEEKEGFDMTKGNDLLTYKLENFTPKAFTKDKEAKEEFAQDQYLGDFMTTGTYVEVYCRDHEYVDGDKVRVYVNGVVVQNSVNLGGGYTPILVKLKRGFNSIEFEALNQGMSGPNTAELRLFDDKGQPLAQKEWNLLTGATARLVVVKN